jgi:hypothetical protein
MSNANDIFLQAIQPVIDIFWSLVWTATSSDRSRGHSRVGLILSSAGFIAR